jgi:glycosyltransferase involved in cell wall biosynthesis
VLCWETIAARQIRPPRREETLLSQSVSFILPVRDLQYELRDRVQSILEILVELTEQIDLLIVDCGSHDDTREVALDLVREYPQVNLLERGEGAELVSAIEAGIQRTTGEIIFIHDPTLPLGPSAVHHLWSLRADEDLLMAQSGAGGTEVETIGHDLPAGFGPTTAGRSSLQMIRRRALVGSPLRRGATHVGLPRLTRTDSVDESVERLRLPKLLVRLRHLMHSG